MDVNRRSPGYRLEQYTLKRPQEVILATITVQGEMDQIAVFKGFSSSLMRPTAFDPDVPVLPDDAELVSFDRVAAPFNPQVPQYIQQDLTWDEMQLLLSEADV
jgi:hypothetical protein